MADISKIIYEEPSTETTIELDIKDAVARANMLPSGGSAGASLVKTASGHEWKILDADDISATVVEPASSSQGTVQDAIDTLNTTDVATRSMIPASITRSSNTFTVKNASGTTLFTFSQKDDDTKYPSAIKSITRSGATCTATHYDDTTSTFTIPITNNVTSTSTTSALAANQGKVLNEKIPASISRSGNTFTAKNSSGDELFTFTQQNSTYPKAVKTVSKSGNTVTCTHYDDTTSTFATTDSTKLPLSGGTMTGTLTMGTNPVYSATTLHVRGKQYLNLRSAAYIQCRNDGDSAWQGINASTFTTQSSERYKENIQLTSDDISDLIYSLTVKRYDYKENVVEDANRFNRVGLLAEELNEVIPEVVSKTEGENGELIPDGIDYAALVPFLLKTIQVQHDDIQILYGAVMELADIISEG